MLNLVLKLNITRISVHGNRCFYYVLLIYPMKLQYTIYCLWTILFFHTTFRFNIILDFSLTGCFSGDICTNHNQHIYCSSGCCGSYKDHHCCSHTGLIVGVVVCVAVITGIVVIYCYLRHRNRKRTHANLMRPVPHGQPIPVLQNAARGNNF